jgi:phospholipase/carboxylesterase
MSQLQYVDIPSKQKHTATVIWLHGLGDSGHGFAPIVPELKLPEDSNVRFIFPHAPERPVTINGGMRMRAWYDIVSMDFNHRADRQGVEESAAQVSELLEAEIAAGIAPENIVLAGFSQGGVIALHMATRMQHKLAGVMALSTYMCEPETLTDQGSDANKQTPIFMAHGQFDDVVPPFLGNAAFKTLEENGYDASMQMYPMQHNVCMEELADIKAFLIKTLNLGQEG